MKDLDSTLDFKERARFHYVYGIAVTHLESQFSQTKLLCLAMIYHKFVLLNGPTAKYMTQEQLSKFIMEMFNVVDPQINDRIVKVLSADADCDDPLFKKGRYCSLQSFVKMFNIYFSNDLEIRMDFVFRVYDLHHVGYISREVVIRFVEKFFPFGDDDYMNEMVHDMTELIFYKFDRDRDLQITFEEYSQIVRNQPLLLEFLGKVFPSEVELMVVATCVNLLPASVDQS